MASVEERLKLKRGQVDTWSTKEKLCLASCVLKCGNQNWMSVSRNLKVFAGEPGRPPDWFSQKSCAVQYDCLLDRVETPKRKKRGADGTKSEGSDISPGELIVKQLVGERIDELKRRMAEVKAMYIRDKEEVNLIESGIADDRLDEFQQQIQEEKRQKEREQESHQKWLKEREERKLEMEWAWRPFVSPQQYRGPASGIPTSQNSAQAGRRSSSQSEVSEADSNVDSSLSVEIGGEETVEANPVPTPPPTSPLLTSLLKSPSQAQSSSILHSAITSQRGASPTITSLLNSSPSIPNNNSTASPNIKALVSNALASRSEDAAKSGIHTASGSPTLSMLLELPPAVPGHPLPELPSAASIQPAASTTVTPPASNTVAPESAPAATTANAVESQPGDAKSDTLPDISAMDIMMPVETEANIAEAERGLNIETADLQHLSHADLELVMDPIDMVLAEGDISLAEEMAVLIEVSSDEVGSTVNSVLDLNSKDAMAVAAQAQKLQAEAEAQLQGSSPAAGGLIGAGLLPENEASVPSSPPAHLTSPPHTSVSPVTPKEVRTPKKNNAIVGGRKIDLEAPPPVEQETATTAPPEPTASIASVASIESEESIKEEEQNDSAEMVEAYVEPRAEDVMRTVGLSEEALENASIVIIQDDGEVLKVAEDECVVEKKLDVEQIERKDIAETVVSEEVVESTTAAVAETPVYPDKVEDTNIIIEIPTEVPKEEPDEPIDKSDSVPALDSPKKEVKPVKVEDMKFKRNSRDVEKESEKKDEKKEDIRRIPLRRHDKKEDRNKAISNKKEETTTEEPPRRIEKYASSEQDISFETSQDSSLEKEQTSLDEDIREEDIMREVTREEVEKTILGITEEKVEVFISEDPPRNSEEETSKAEEPAEKPRKDESPEKSKKDDLEKLRKEETRSSRDSVKGARQRRNSRREKSPDVVESSAGSPDDIPIEKRERDTNKKERKSSTSQESDKSESKKTEVSALKKEEKEARRREEEAKLEEEQDKSAAGAIVEMAETADDSSRPGDSDKESSVKYDKTNRSETPSTEDDKTSDIEQQSTRSASARRARSGRDYSDSVPSSPASTQAISDEEKDYRAWKKSIMLVYGRIAAHKSASLFLRPITDDKAPGYSQMIYRPMDLFTMKKNIENGVIRTTAEFQRDILLMFNNAIMYNKSGSHVHSMASAMQEEGVQILKEFVHTQLLLQAVGSDGSNVPSRRGTRTTEKRDQEGEKTSTPKSGNTPVPTPSSASGNTYLQAGKRKRSIVPDEKIVSKRRKADDS